MKLQRDGFTLIELLVVISIIALLILIFVPQIPAIVRWYRYHLSHVIMKQLEYGVDEYKRVYGQYPHESMVWSEDKGVETTDYWRTNGAYSLYLALQGPDGAGWGPTEKDPGILEFGPIPESPGFAARDSHQSNPWGHTDQYGMKIRGLFRDPFDRQILYYSAHMDSQVPDISSGQYYTAWRYNFGANGWSWIAGAKQRGADEVAYHLPGDYVMAQGKGWAEMHWQVRLTASMVKKVRYPYNPTSYIIWMAGADERFGYWFWSEEHSGFVADLNPEMSQDNRFGICDDILNCGGG